MIINVGSTNETKIKAVINATKSILNFDKAKVKSFDVKVEEFGHPKSLEETVEGAKQRAKASFADCDLSVGIEGGLMKVPGTKTGYMETAVCSIYDGKQHHLGLAPSFEWPKEVLSLILAGSDGSKAFKEVGLTDHEKIGAKKGAIHILSKGKLDRTRLNELAVIMALVHIENPGHY